MKIKHVLWLVPGLVLVLSGCAQVSVNTLSDEKEEYELIQVRSEPPKDFESRALRKQAEALCPTGYEYLLRHAQKSAEFVKHHAACGVGEDCGYELKWRIRCGDIPREPFSLFGKT